MHVTKDAMTFTRPELRALLAHASTDDTRPHLWGVAIDLTRGRAFATDGHRLCLTQARVTPTLTTAVAACVVARDVLERAVRACGTRGRIAIRRYALTEATAGSSSVLGAGDDYVSVEVLDENDKQLVTAHARIGAAAPPQIDAIVPVQDLKAKRTVWTTLDARYLADLALVAAAAETTAGVRCWAATGPLDPVLHDVDGETAYWQIVIMPVRGDEAPKVPVAPETPAPTVVQLGAPPVATDTPKRRRKAKAEA